MTLPNTMQDWRDLVSNKDVKKAKGDTAEAFLENILKENTKIRTADGKLIYDSNVSFANLPDEQKLRLTLAVRENLLDMDSKDAKLKLNKLDEYLGKLITKKETEIFNNLQNGQNQELETKRTNARNIFKDENNAKPEYSNLQFNDKSPVKWEELTPEVQKTQADKFKDDKSVKSITSVSPEVITEKEQDITRVSAEKDKLAQKLPTLSKEQATAHKGNENAFAMQSFVLQNEPSGSIVAKAGTTVNKNLTDGKFGVYSLVAMSDSQNTSDIGKGIITKLLADGKINEKDSQFLTNLTIGANGEIGMLKISKDKEGNSVSEVKPLNTEERAHFRKMQQVITHIPDAELKTIFDAAQAKAVEEKQAQVTKLQAEQSMLITPEQAETKKLETQTKLAKEAYETQYNSYNTKLTEAVNNVPDATKTSDQLHINATLATNKYIQNIMADVDVSHAAPSKDYSKTVGKMKEVFKSGADLGQINAANGIDTPEELKLEKLAKDLGLNMVAKSDGFHLTVGNVDFGNFDQFTASYGSAPVGKSTVKGKGE